SLALATETEIAAIDLSALDDVAEEALATWLADPAITKTAHDTKLVTHQLSGRGLTVAGWRTDLAIAEFLCRRDPRPTAAAGPARGRGGPPGDPPAGRARRARRR